jgi:hypothetical protein
MPHPMADARLAEIRALEAAATEGPWWFDEDEHCWRLHGVHGRIPACDPIPEQVMNKQILKAPKTGTPYAEYWPDPADAAFIVEARTIVPELLVHIAGLEAELAETRADRELFRRTLERDAAARIGRKP